MWRACFSFLAFFCGVGARAKSTFEKRSKIHELCRGYLTRADLTTVQKIRNVANGARDVTKVRSRASDNLTLPSVGLVVGVYLAVDLDSKASDIGLEFPASQAQTQNESSTKRQPRRKAK